MEDVEDIGTGQIDTAGDTGGGEGSPQRKAAGQDVLGEGDIEGRLKEIRGKVPSFILNDLRKSLMGKPLTSQQLSKIIERTLREYHERNKGGLNTGVGLTAQLAEMNEKIEMLMNAMSPGGNAGLNMDSQETAAADTVARDMVDNIRKQIDGIPPEKILFGDGSGSAKLHDIPEDVVSIMISLKWLEFLIEKVGLSNMSKVLEFYCDLNWISENALSRLMRYSKGTKPSSDSDRTHDGNSDGKMEEKLSARDHIMSLLFIERLRGNRISQDVLEQLERELKKIRRGVEELYGV